MSELFWKQKKIENRAEIPARAYMIPGFDSGDGTERKLININSEIEFIDGIETEEMFRCMEEDADYREYLAEQRIPISDTERSVMNAEEMKVNTEEMLRIIEAVRETHTLAEFYAIFNDTGYLFEGTKMYYTSEIVHAVQQALEEGDESFLATVPSICGIREKALELVLQSQNEVMQVYGNPPLHDGIEPVDVLEFSKATAFDNENREKENEKNRSQKVFADFSERFSISSQELESVSGFSELSTGQKRLVYENFSELLLGKGVHVAQDTYREEIQKERSERTVLGSNLLGKVWVGFREAFLKEEHIHTHERTETGKLFGAGIGEHREILSQLVLQMSAGPNVYFNDRGECRVEYMRGWEGISEKTEHTLFQFNRCAENESKRTYEDYVAARISENNLSAYEESKHALIAAMEEQGIPQSDIAVRIAKADSNVMMSRFMATNGQIEEVLDSIKNQTIWTKALKSLGSERSMYAVGGYVTRTAVSGVLGMFAAPLVAMGIGGMRAWTRSGAELREKDRAQREGRTVDTETALNMINAQGDRGALRKLRLSCARIDAIDDRLGTLDTGSDAYVALCTERTKLVASAVERLSYTEDKLMQGRINFGNTHALSAQYELMQEFSHAKVRLLDAEMNERLHERLSRVLARKEQGMQMDRFRYRVKKTGEGSLIAGGFAFLGSFIGELFNAKEDMVNDVVQERPLMDKMTSTIAEASPEPVSDTLPESSDITTKVMNDIDIVEKEMLPEYPVTKGDTLTQILRIGIPEISELSQPRVQEITIANFIHSLSKEELQAVGIRSGNANLIRIGEKINLEKMQALYRTLHS